MKEEILKLREEGKSYNEIKTILGCTKGMVCYHCGKDQKEKSLNRQRKNRKKKPLLKKLHQFKSRSLRIKVNDFQRNKSETGAYTIGRDYNFTYEDLLEKVINDPKCYLSGRKIDLNLPNTYHLDHIIPVSKGGQNILENLGLTCKEANKGKDDLTIEEFIGLCKDILEFNGYSVTKGESQLTEVHGLENR